MVLPNISSYNYYDDLNSGLFPSNNIILDSFYNWTSKMEIKELNILAHSFGTYITQIILNDPRNTFIKKTIMVDPIIFWICCFKMSTYIDKYPEQSESIITNIAELLINQLIYQCLYLRYICLRAMFGPDFWIYNAKELEGKNILLVLEYDDHVVPSEFLYKKIKDYDISYYYLSDALHGSVLLDPKFESVFKDIIEYYN